MSEGRGRGPQPAHAAREAVRRFIETEFPGAAADGSLADDEPLIGGGIIDSLGIFVLVGFLEQEFAIQVRPEDVTVENFATVATIAQLVERRRAAPAP